MNYTYEIKKLLPKQEFMVVVYSADGFPDYTQTYNPHQFDEPHLKQIIESGASRVVEYWERWAQHPEEVALTQLQGSAEYTPPVVEEIDPNYAPTIEPEPEFDPFTQYITLNQIEDPMQPTVGWTVHDMTAEEQAEYLTNWRQYFQVSMRQARLALIQQGLLENVNAAIAAMPEPDKSIVETEWEYAHIVDRGSPWMGQMAIALGLSDEQLDDLFKLAATL